MKKVVYYFLSASFLFSAVWGVMWFFSSSSLASSFCENQFSLFHELFRCRQPYLAIILSITSIALFFTMIILGMKNKKR